MCRLVPLGVEIRPLVEVEAEMAMEVEEVMMEVLINLLIKLL
jgi:hypothetical protein